MSYEVQDFQTEVIEKSRELPILVDFWAPWCGPCRVIGPILEKLADESNGRFRLAKVNTDENPELSGRYGIRGIPAVKLFSEGQIVDEFTGALPEYAISQWLDKALPSEGKKLVSRAQTALDAGDEAAAQTLLEEALQVEPGQPQAGVMLARLIVFDDPERAAALVEGSSFAGAGLMQVEEAVKTVSRLYRMAGNDQLLPEDTGSDTYRAALAALKHRDFEAAIERFIEVIQRNRYYDDDGARKACVALFNLLGDEHPATRKYRRLFDMSLY